MGSLLTCSKEAYKGLIKAAVKHYSELTGVNENDALNMMFESASLEDISSSIESRIDGIHCITALFEAATS
jgi:hypothetical protein